MVAAVLIGPHRDLHLLQSVCQLLPVGTQWQLSPVGCGTPPGHSGRVPGVGEGGVRREADRGHGAGEGEGRAQGQDGDVIQLIVGVVLRMVRDPRDCPDIGGGVRGVMLPQRHLEIGA